LVKYTFTPDWVSSPGDTIIDLLQERNWTQSQLSVRLGYFEKAVDYVLDKNRELYERLS
jgi:HTH-type transcriptional regulator/antitoxin HigA